MTTPFDTLRRSIGAPPSAALAGMNFEREWDYRYTERLGNLCGSAEPTPAQKRIAREEADAAIKGFRDHLKLMETFNTEEP